LPGRKKWRHGYGLSSEPLRVATKLLVPLSLMFAAYLFLKGHQSPGGGFVAGLVAAVALTAHRMAHGRSSLKHLLRVKEKSLVGVGLLLSLGTGIGPMLMGLPFMTSRYGYLTLPGTDHRVEWTTVLIFDFGVFLVVLGVVQMMINALFEQSEAA
jgi:multisubunit Na+/H+ antiporter MnhB subunit